MIQFVVGAAAGYLMGTKAGRKRYDQIKRGAQAAVSSPATKAVVKATRKAVARKLDPEPRMKEVKNLRGRSSNRILEPDDD
ncbi:hypothetical protein ACFSSC_03045 [Corynebacterium mendelii]|uniref:YtxH domain-containing protein n=1 Tax=Corynebacterium mendelii TaxID=2765362 RepID=A0A939IX99_9CORY|nr:hypothetical protein [Corynebacterium mendelii]MBN9644255.1 hypothetical protein [Corynebacterium mendelii]